MRPETQAEVRAHAEREYPRECCGLLLVVDGMERYYPCRNIATNSQSQHFVIHHEDYADAEELGDIVAVVHSHPNASPNPSEADRVMCELSKLPWHIVHVSVPDIDGASIPVAGDIVSFVPNGYEAPLVGRTWCYGVLDCLQLIRDYYKRELQIELPDFPDHEYQWWKKGQDLYMEELPKNGFVPATGKLQVGDVILMQIRSKVANHAAVYIGNGLVLQHLERRLSSRDVYDGYFQEVTRAVFRYQGGAQ